MKEVLCLKWNNHNSAFLKNLHRLRTKELFCDATLVCCGKYYPVHRFVLTTCSEYFEEIFSRTPCKHPFIVLKDVDDLHLEAILSYMYKGEVNVLQDNLAEFIKVAETLQVKGLAISGEDNNVKKSPKKGLSSEQLSTQPSPSSDSLSHPHSAPTSNQVQANSNEFLQAAASQPLQAESSQKASIKIVSDPVIKEKGSVMPITNQESDKVDSLSESEFITDINSQYGTEDATDINSQYGTEDATDINSQYGPEDATDINSQYGTEDATDINSQYGTEDVNFVDICSKIEEQCLNSNQQFGTHSERDPDPLEEIVKREPEEVEPADNIVKREHHEIEMAKSKFEENIEGSSHSFMTLLNSAAFTENDSEDQTDSMNSLVFPQCSSWKDNISNPDSSLSSEMLHPTLLIQDYDTFPLESMQSLVDNSMISHGTFSSEGRKKRREAEVSSGKVWKYVCEECNFNTNDKAAFRVHMMRKHTFEKPFSCSLCSYRCTTKDMLKIHMRKHTGERPFSCPYCNCRMSVKSRLKRHILLKHMQTSNKQKSKSLHHPESTEPLKVFKCTECTYESEMKSKLKLHLMRKHTGEKPFTCTLCPYGTTTKPQLDIHMRKHTGEKPFVCSFCNYKSAQKHNLLRHMTKHTK